MTAQPLAPSLAPRPWLSGAARPHRRLAGMAALATIADVAPAVGFAGGLALAVHHLPQSPVAAAPWIALAVVALAARGLLGQGALVLSARLARRVKADARTRALQALFASPGSADKRLTAAVEGVEALDGYYARFAPARTAAALSPLLLIAAAALASPMSAAILLFTLVPFIAGMALAGTAAAAESRRQFDALERLSGLFLDRVRALPALLAFGAEARTGAEIEQAATTLAARTSRVLRVAFLSSGVLEFFSALSTAASTSCGFCPFPRRRRSTCLAPCSCWRWRPRSMRPCAGWPPPIMTVRRRRRPRRPFRRPPSPLPRRRPSAATRRASPFDRSQSAMARRP